MPNSPLPSLRQHLDAKLASDLAAIRNRVRLPTRSTGSIPGRNANAAASDGPVIETLATWLLDEEQKQELAANPLDIFYLYATAYLLEREAQLPAPAGTVDDQGVAAPGLHASIQSLLGVSDNRTAEIIGQIYAGYLAGDNLGEVVAPAIEDGDREVVHVQFLAACLRLAADLWFDSPPAALQLRSFSPLDSFEENTDLIRFFSVASVGPHPHVQATILARLDCSNAEVHRALKRYESSLQRRLSMINRTVRPRFLFTSVVFEIQPSGYRPIDFRFSVDTSAALQLFMGNTLYKDRRVFLRELVQNAVDACNLRKLKEPDYAPAIELAFNSDISRITVTDNGIGMSRQWIEKYFLNIGLSFYQSAEIENINRDQTLQFSFISRFGIGFLSSFLVAEKVIVTTRKADSVGLVITISSADDYFDVRQADRSIPIGTQVTVQLKNSHIAYCRSMEYLGYLKTNVRFLPIPVTFIDENANRSVLGQEPMDYSQESLWGTKFVARLDYRQSQGYLLLRVLENYQYIYDLEAAQGGIAVFQDGIFIDQVAYLLPENAAAYVVGRINLVGDEKCELSMDRNHLYWAKDQLARTKHMVLMGLVTLANDLLAKLSGQVLPENVRSNLLNKLASFFHFNDVDDVLFEKLNSDIRVRLQEKFRLFIRANRFQFDLSRHRQSRPDISHGYSAQWQRQIIDGFMQKKAEAEKRRQMN